MRRANDNYPRPPGLNHRLLSFSFHPSSFGPPQGLRWPHHEERPINSVFSDSFLFPPEPFQVFDNNTPRERNLWTIPEPSTRSIAPPYANLHQQEESRLSQNDQNNALKKLRKEIYNPMPKTLSRRVNLYYRDNNSIAKSNIDQKEKPNNKDGDDGGKSCAVCLEDFEAKEVVMVTPCSHMFHEDCIVPWAKSQGHCPVCRAAIADRGRESADRFSSTPANLGAGNLLEDDLASIIRYMEESIGHVRRRR